MWQRGRRGLSSPTSIHPSMPRPLKLGEIIGLEIRKQKSRTAKKGYSERRWANVKWDIRSRPEWVVETRLVHENELESHELLTRLEA